MDIPSITQAHKKLCCQYVCELNKLCYINISNGLLRLKLKYNINSEYKIIILFSVHIYMHLCSLREIQSILLNPADINIFTEYNTNLVTVDKCITMTSIIHDAIAFIYTP